MTQGGEMMPITTSSKNLNLIIPGPQKKDLKPRTPKLRHSGHKQRSVWLQARSAWPLREAPVHTLELQTNRVNRHLPPPTPAAPCRPVSPTTVGARTPRR